MTKARQDFQLARNPVLADLKVGSTWTCITYHALKGTTLVEGPAYSFTFEEFSGFLRNEWEPTNFKNFVFQGGQLLGCHVDFDHAHLYVRVSQAGDLVLEATADKEGYAPGEAVASLANPAKIGGSYIVCPLAKLDGGN